MGRVWVPLIIYPLVGVEKNELKKKLFNKNWDFIFMLWNLLEQLS
jgi:hypothetical protein